MRMNLLKRIPSQNRFDHSSLRRGRIFLRRLIFTHMLILVISTVGTWIIGGLALSNMRNISEKSLESQIDYLMNEVDGYLTEIAYMSNSLSINSDIYKVLMQDSIHGEVPPENVLAGRKQLSLLSRPYLVDVAIYYPRSGRFVSNNHASLDAREYIATNYNAKGNYERIFAAMEREQTYRFIGLRDSTDTMAVILSLPRDLKRNPLGYMMVVIDPSVFAQIRQLATELSAYLQVDSPDGQSLFSYGKDLTDDFHVINKVSNYGLKLSFKLPNEELLTQFQALQLRLILLTGSSVLIGTLMALYLSKKTYEPIGSLTELVSMNNQEKDKASRTDELEIIRHELMESYLQLQQNSNIKKENLFRDLLLSEYPDEVRNTKISDNKLYSDFLKSSAVLISLELQQDQDESPADLLAIRQEGSSLLKTIITNVMNELFAEKYECVYNQESQTRFTILILPLISQMNPHSSDLAGDVRIDLVAMEEEAKKQLTQFQLFSRNDLKLTFHAAYAVVPVVRNDLSRVYNRLKSALKQAQINDSKLFLTPGDVPDQVPPYNFHIDTLLLLVRSSIQENKPLPSMVFREMLNQMLTGKPLHGEQFQHMKMDVLILMQKIADDYELESDGLLLLKETTTLKTFEQVFTNLIEELRTYYLIQNKSQQSSQKAAAISDRIDTFIEGNYADPGLGLAQLEDLFQLSSPYLSSLYTSYRGYSINDKINLTRIKVAKDLLLTTDLTVSEIALRCGFLYSTVFIRTFKRLEQTTPGIYRRVNASFNESK